MSSSVAIIDYGSGNLRSVARAFERAAADAHLNAAIHVTDDPEIIASADRIALPGVGAFAACMGGLKARDGVIEALEHTALVRARPFIGICVGMQLLATRGREFGDHPGLGWIPGDVAPIAAGDVEVPHMGWNIVTASDRRIFPRQLDAHSFYFAHSFAFKPENDADIYAVTHHGGEIVAAIGRDNILGVQFHPEKSQSAGIALIADFLQWTP